MKLFFISSSLYILFLMKRTFRPTFDPNIDTFKIEFLVIGAFAAAMVFNYDYSFSEVPTLPLLPFHHPPCPPFLNLQFSAIGLTCCLRCCGHSVFGLRVWLFCLNCLSFRELARQRISRRIICLRLGHIGRCTFQIGFIGTMQMIISILLPQLLE
jgi:ER lumen protein retaining receptor